MTHFRPAAPTLWALALLIPLAACTGDEAPQPASDAVTPPATEVIPPPPAEMMHATIPLSQVNSSGVSGEAMAMHSDDAVVVILELDGLIEEGEYAAHIHIGTCAEGGPVTVTLNPILGLADGTGTSTTTLEAEELAQGDPHFLMVHGKGGTPIVCGDMEGHSN